MALIVILSVFNGFEDLVSSLYNTFDADIQISKNEGKFFDPGDLPVNKLKTLDHIISYSEVIEGSVLLRSKQEQYVAKLKGVSPSYFQDNPLQNNIIEGNIESQNKSSNTLLLGYYIAYKLGVSTEQGRATSIDIFTPDRKKRTFSDLNSAFKQKRAIPTGVFSIQQDIDSKYVITSIDLARELFQYKTAVSSIEIRFKEGSNIKQLQQEIESLIGQDFTVKNRYQQQEVLYKVMHTEKWFIFFILIFILTIAIFNLISSLTMLILDKVKDISLLYGMGMSVSKIRRIFILEGMMIILLGEIIGLLLGAFICYLQQEFGLIRLGNNVNAFLVPFYPVKFHWMDFVTSIISVSVIGFLASLIPAMRIKEKFLQENVLRHIRGR